MAHALPSLLPVLCYLGALVLLDSYKLVRPMALAAMVGIGAALAVAAYVGNAWLLAVTGLNVDPYTRYVAPVLEEALKASIIVWLIRRQRIGFLVDAAIAGFAVGCGFALVENVVALLNMRDAGWSTWVVRGFGTAIMHGGATAVFALTALALLERDERRPLRALLPGFVAAVLLHSAFNHLSRQPWLATLGVLVGVPALLLLSFEHSERALEQWLGGGFDNDTELLELLDSGGLSHSPVGRYLASLRMRFPGAIVADLLCYLRLFTELALRARGALMLREAGFDAAIDDATRDKLAELDYLEGSIGRTGLLALQPLLPMRRKVLSRLYMLQE